MKAGIKIVGYILRAISAASYGIIPSFALPLYAAGIESTMLFVYPIMVAVIMAAVYRALS